MQSMEEIYQKYFQTVYKYVLCLSNGNKELSEDITSETFVVAVESINEFQGKCKISVWLCQIAKFLFYKEIKRKNKVNFEELENVKDIINIEDELIEKEEKMKIFKDIQKLDEKTKDVMYLRLIGDLSFEEIADVTGRTANWARVTYFRGKEKIKEENKNERRKRM